MKNLQLNYGTGWKGFLHLLVPPPISSKIPKQINVNSIYF